MDLPEDIEAYCVCPACTKKHLQPASHRGTCSMVEARAKHMRDLSVLVAKDSRVISIEFKDPVRPNADGNTKSIHIAALAYYSRVVERLIIGALSSSSGNKRLVTVIEFEDDILKPGDVDLLVEWCATGSLASLAKAYRRPVTRTIDDEDEVPAEETEIETEYDDDDDDVEAKWAKANKGSNNSTGGTTNDQEEIYDKKQRRIRRKVMNKRKRKANIDKKLDEDLKNYTSRRIPKFAAEDTIERLYCIAADLEMPELANYCMRLLMAKYSWNFFSIGPIEVEEDEFAELSALERTERIDDQRRKAVEEERAAKRRKGHQQPRSSAPKDKAEKKENFRGKDCQVPFKLMFRDAPFEADGLRFAVREVFGDNRKPTRNKLGSYMLALVKQRNAEITKVFTCEPNVYIDNWKAALLGDEVFKDWYRQHYQLPSTIKPGRDTIGRVEALLDWSRYMIDVDKFRKDAELADPERLWAKLMAYQIHLVVMEEQVQSRLLRTREDDDDLSNWSLATCNSQRKAGSKILAEKCAKYILHVKRNLNVFQFGDH